MKEQVKMRTEWIHPSYQEETTVKLLREAFAKHASSIQLQSFLEEKHYHSVLQQLLSLQYTEEYEPLSHRFAVFRDMKQLSAFTSFIHSQAFTDFLFMITGEKVEKHKGCVYLFGHGDYILHRPAEKVLYVIFDFTEEWEMELGGYSIFGKQEKEPVVITPLRNSLSLVKGNDCEMYLKYINHHAKQRKMCQFVVTFFL